MSFIIAVTDQDWFEFHRQKGSINNVNFWTPTPWGVRTASVGDEWFFMLHSPIRKIGGFGIFQSYTELTLEESWRRFGSGNGFSSKHELIAIIREYAEKRSVSPFSGAASVIGSIHLDDCQFFDDDDFIDLSDSTITFKPQITKFKAKFKDERTGFPVRSFPLPIPDRNLREPKAIDEFELVGSSSSEYDDQRRRRREGQQSFRRALMDAYEGRCAFTGESIEDTLNACHIEPYINPNSNHIQNGLLLRADIHILFDRGLISVDIDRSIMTDSILEGSEYEALSGEKMRLPKSPLFHPSKEALKIHRTTIFQAHNND